mmetsp:Transcript_11510/g.31040  ORF Transcript_11510/g.31040 Transcript_11510/m.31040 type:complete len:127 (+) Transcript_11510:321-701(+)
MADGKAGGTRRDSQEEKDGETEEVQSRGRSRTKEFSRGCARRRHAPTRCTGIRGCQDGSRSPLPRVAKSAKVQVMMREQSSLNSLVGSDLASMLSVLRLKECEMKSTKELHRSKPLDSSARDTFYL